MWHVWKHVCYYIFIQNPQNFHSFCYFGIGSDSFYFHIKAEKWLFLRVFWYLKNNKNSRSCRCSNIVKTRVFRSFRLELLENLTWWINSEPGFGFCAKNYFGNDYRYFYNNHNLIFCRPLLSMADIKKRKT